MSPNNIRPV